MSLKKCIFTSEFGIFRVKKTYVNANKCLKQTNTNTL